MWTPPSQMTSPRFDDGRILSRGRETRMPRRRSGRITTWLTVCSVLLVGAAVWRLGMTRASSLRHSTSYHPRHRATRAEGQAPSTSTSATLTRSIPAPTDDWSPHAADTAAIISSAFESSTPSPNEASYRTCCGARMRHHAAIRRKPVCKGAGSSMYCTFLVDGREEVLWFCELHNVILHPKFTNVTFDGPTVSNPFRWAPGTLVLLGCTLEEGFTSFRFKGMMENIFPTGLHVRPEISGPLPDIQTAADEITLLTIRVSPRNFWLGHRDLLQTYALRQMAGDQGAVRIVIFPPDKASNGQSAFWGPHRVRRSSDLAGDAAWLKTPASPTGCAPAAGALGSHV